MTEERKPDIIKRDQDEFIDAIKTEIRKGVTFTPLIGSGVSAGSGLILGSDLADYLTYVVYRAICPDSVQKDEDSVKRSRWCVRGDGWPRRPTESQMTAARKWLAERYRLMVDGRPDGQPLPPPFPASLSRFDPTQGRNRHSYGEILPLEELAKYGVEPVLWEAQMSEVERLTLIAAKAMDGHREKMLVTNLWASFFEAYPSTDEPTQEKVTRSATITPKQLQEGAVMERALRSLGDWKSILAFLCRIFTDRHGNLVYGRKPKAAVIDRFNTHISWGQKPNLAHTLLVHLSRPLGFRKLITTNFDTLIEQAFEEAEIPLRTVEATVTGDLPDHEIVRSAATLIKIHGGNHQTRADFSLNQRASLADRKAFCGYLLPERRLGEKRRCKFSMSHLLLLGVGGGDWRMNDMVDHALRTIPGLKVFCVASSSSSAAKLTAVFSRWVNPAGTNGPRVMVSELGKADIALLRIYQEIALSLPPGGFSSRLVQPIPPWLAQQHHIQAARKWIFESVPTPRTELRPLHLEDEGNTLKVKLRPSKQEHWVGCRVDCHLRSGVIFVLGSLFFGYEQMYRPALWFELEDFAQPGDLIGQVVMLLAIRRGLHQTSHVDFDKHPGIPHQGTEALQDSDLAEWLGRMLDYLNLDASQCALFFYGRNGSGGCSGFDNEYWGAKQNQEMEMLCDVLASIGFHVYYAPFSEKRRIDAKIRESEIGRLASQMMSAHSLPEDQAEYFNLAWPPDACSQQAFGPLSQRIPDYLADGRTLGTTDAEYSASKTSERKIRWNQLSFMDTARQVAHAFLLDKKDDLAGPHVWNEVADKVKEASVKGLWDRLLFLYACTLFRQSRHYTALISEGTYPCPCRYTDREGCDNDLKRSETAWRWLKVLKESCDLFHEKSGGFLWMYRDTRLGLQHLLERLREIHVPSEEGESNKSAKGFDFLVQNRSRLHYWIGDWYRQAFFSTGHIIPLGEAFYHWVMALRFVPWLKQPTRSMSEEKDAPFIAHRRLQMIVSALGEMSELIDQGESAICFWSPGDPASRLINWQLIAKAISLDPSSHSVESPADSLDRNIVEKWLIKMVGNGLQWTPDLAWQTTHVVLVEDLLNRVRLSAKMVEAKARGEASLNGWSHPRANPRPLKQGGISSNDDGLNPSFPFAGIAPDFGFDLVSINGEKDSEQRIEAFFDKLFSEESAQLVGPPEIAPSESALKDALRWTYETSESWLEETRPFLPQAERLGRIDRVTRTYSKLACFCLQKPNSAFLLIDILAECAYFRVKQAKLLERILRSSERSAVSSSQKSPPLKTDARFHWLTSSMICSLGLMLLRLTYSQGGDERTCIKQKLLSLYGLSLSYLGRFNEAHKRINEATALCESLGASERATSRMILRLRRAELHLAEAEQSRVKGGDANLRWAVKKVDDAVFSLDAAQHVMMGVSQSSLWWGRFYALKLRILNVGALLATVPLSEGELPLSMAFRRMHDYYAHVGDYYVRADLLCHNDAYRSLRFVDYAYSCLSSLHRVLEKSPPITDMRGEVESTDGTSISDSIGESSPNLLRKITKSWKRVESWRGDGSKWSPEMNRYYSLVERILPDDMKR